MYYLINIIKNSDILETVSFFSSEIVLFFAFLFNLILFLIFKRNPKAKRLSDFVTSLVFVFNFILCFIMYFNNFNNEQFTVTFLDDFLYQNVDVLFTKTVINLFMLLFLFSTYRLVRSISYKATLINAYLCLIALSSSIIIQVNNILLTFFFLDLNIFLIFKYGSSFKFNTFKYFQSDYLFANIVSTILFYSVAFALMFNDSDNQITILNFCLLMAYMLKIGIFPSVNFFNLKSHKNNLPYSILLYSLVLYTGIAGFVKIFNSSVLSGDIFLAGVVCFLVLCAFNVLLYARKTKNLLKFLSCSCQYFAIFVILEFLVSLDEESAIRLASLYLFASLAVYTLLCIFKINSRSTKMSLNNFRAIFLKNRTYAFLFSLSLLLLFSVVPSGVFLNFINGMKNIYSCDRFGYILFVIFAFVSVLMILKVFDIILNCYNFEKNAVVDTFTKKTTLNYVAFWISVILLFILIL